MAELRVFHAAGKFGRMIPVRVRPGTDVMEGLRKVCQELGVKYGAVLFGIGSIRQLCYQVLVPKKDSIWGAGYTDPETIPGPVEIVGIRGVIFQSEDGKETLLHIHGTFSDQKGKVFGGHLVMGKNPVLATCDAVIAELAGAKMVRKVDPEIGMGCFNPEP
jgi:hypothetical protein